MGFKLFEFVPPSDDYESDGDDAGARVGRVPPWNGERAAEINGAAGGAVEAGAPALAAAPSSAPDGGKEQPLQGGPPYDEVLFPLWPRGDGSDPCDSWAPVDGPGSLHPLIEAACDVAVDELADAILGLPGTSPLQAEIHTATKHRNVEETQWAPRTPAGMEWERMVSFFEGGGYRVRECQRWLVKRPGVLHVFTASVQTFAPYCDKMRTMLLYEMVGIGPQKTLLRIRYYTKFIAPVNGMLRGIINNGAGKGLRNSFAASKGVIYARYPCTDDAATLASAWAQARGVLSPGAPAAAAVPAVPAVKAPPPRAPPSTTAILAAAVVAGVAVGSVAYWLSSTPERRSMVSAWRSTITDAALAVRNPFNLGLASTAQQ
ncbi:unnamed protein product [Pedinophyceae sp. YPF-701]|nr:unnamed protein product [Pedinophyceae sp. YPF-701]